MMELDFSPFNVTMISPSYRCGSGTMNNTQLFTFAKEWNSIPETIILNLIVYFVSIIESNCYHLTSLLIRFIIELIRLIREISTIIPFFCNLEFPCNIYNTPANSME